MCGVYDVYTLNDWHNPQVRKAFLSVVDNVLDARTSELLMGQTQANSSTMYVTQS